MSMGKQTPTRRSLPKAISRRAFLRPPVPAYIGSPLIDHRVCAADKGCMACADVCPKDAYLWTEGRIVYAKNECEPCGQCVTTCPTEAISNPTATPAMIEAQVKALIAAAPNPIGARFVCSRGSGRQVEGWANISVPCTSMVPGSWLLATMLIGAAGAYAEPCADSSCPLGLDAQTNQANELAHAVLEECHLDPSVVSGTTLGAPIGPVAIDDPFGRRRTPEIIAALATAASTAIDIAHPAADLGIVSIDDATCTLCGRCAQACPTHALAESYEDDVVSISFDAKACVNCTQCISACPEVERGAIAVTGRYWVDALDAGRTELNSGTITSCEICGNAIAPTLMMDRIRDILGDEFAGSMSTIGKRCLDCRGR
jgi:ferredoxin